LLLSCLSQFAVSLPAAQDVVHCRCRMTDESLSPVLRAFSDGVLVHDFLSQGRKHAQHWDEVGVQNLGRKLDYRQLPVPGPSRGKVLVSR
jgi:hypothetical protein